MNIHKITDHLPFARDDRFGEIVRFAIVGATATLIQYGVYWLLMHWSHDTGTAGTAQSASLHAGHVWPTIAMTIAYLVSFVFNFIASTRYTFRVKANMKRGAGFALSHVVNYFSRWPRSISSLPSAYRRCGRPYPCSVYAFPPISCWYVSS